MLKWNSCVNNLQNLKAWQFSLETVHGNMSRMSIRTECITKKLTFSHEKLHSSFDSFEFSISEDSREAKKLTDLEKF